MSIVPAVTYTSPPAGTTLIHWACMPAMSSSGSAIRYPQDSAPGIAFVPPPGYSVVDAEPRNAEGKPTLPGVWAGRYQAGVPGPVPDPAPKPVARAIIGCNGATGWGPTVSTAILGVGITSERLTFAPESTSMENCATPAQSKALGFSRQTAVVGNVLDGTPLSSVAMETWLSNVLAQAKLAQESGVAFLELGNEMYVKGNTPQPSAYVQMYMMAKPYLVEHGITLPLGFCTTGQLDGMLWLSACVTAQPTLRSLIDCLVTHPYNRAHVEENEHRNGINAVEWQHGQAVNLGLVNADRWLITETGIQYTPGQTGPAAEPTEAGQASALSAVLAQLTSLPYVERVDIYTARDDGTGSFGLLNANNQPRPALATVGGYARAGS